MFIDATGKLKRPDRTPERFVHAVCSARYFTLATVKAVFISGETGGIITIFNFP
jgi:hypothetical protein